ncbi:MAG: sigma-70 family RNA polymerase sigma factor [Longimicrobiales bacterium]
MKTRSEVTGLLQHWAAGDRNALDRLIPLIYDELMRLARRHLHRERPDHTLSSAALVHEAYLRLVDVDRASFQSRAHFLAMASRAMRRLLVDHARQRTAQKRGGGARALALDDVLQLADKDASRFLELHDALGRLESAHARRATALEQYYFGGLTPDEIADAMNVSRSTVERDLRFGRAWLATQLSPTPNPS